VFAVLEAVSTRLTAAMSGVSAITALMAKPETSKPSRAVRRELIGKSFRRGLAGSVDSSSDASEIKCKPVHLLKPGYLVNVHQLASCSPGVARKACSRHRGNLRVWPFAGSY
jgi:hypothetical protein